MRGQGGSVRCLQAPAAPPAPGANGREGPEDARGERWLLGQPLVAQSLVEQVARRSCSIYIIIPVKTTPRCGNALVNRGLKKLNPLQHSLLDGKLTPAR